MNETTIWKAWVEHIEQRYATKQDMNTNPPFGTEISNRNGPSFAVAWIHDSKLTIRHYNVNKITVNGRYELTAGFERYDLADPTWPDRADAHLATLAAEAHPPQVALR